jgi:glucosamine-6-phosphate deaminase
LSLDVEVCPTTEWPGRVAGRLSEMLVPDRRICLATGATTRPIYRHTTATGSPEVFLLDEFGGLPEDDPARCASMLRRDIPELPFHAPDVDAPDPDEAAHEYGALISKGGLDLAVVGLGRNGHVGMNEPGSTPDSTTRVVSLHDVTATGALTYGASTKPKWGITVGISELLWARELWLVVSGRAKSGILDRVMKGPIDAEVPATFLHEHPNAVVLADAAAAAAP